MAVNFEKLAKKLENSPDYRIQRRLPLTERFNDPKSRTLNVGVVLDTETNGTASTDEIIELAMVKFSYDDDGVIYEILDVFSKLRQPKKPIPDELIKIHEITNEMVEGKVITSEEVEKFLSDVKVIIAHFASFDRPMCERLNPIFITKPWACSYDKVPWKTSGYQGAKLIDLVAASGYFYGVHAGL